MALALDKASAKELMKSAGVSTPNYQILTPKTLSTFSLSFPCIVKPAGEHASHSISAESVVYDILALGKQVSKVSKSFGGKALVEEFADGREFNATVMGNKEIMVLPISEIIYTLPPGQPRILTYEAKWQPGSVYYKDTNSVSPATLNKTEENEIKDTAEKVSRLLDAVVTPGWICARIVPAT